MKFERYNDIENSYRQKMIEKIALEGQGKGLWCVKEKIHGANFSFHMDKDGPITRIKAASRNHFLKEDENFHNYRRILKERSISLINLYSDIENSYDNIDSFIIYGELFGGHYPHKDIERIKNVSKIQNKVWYTPNTEFLMFDIKVNGEYLSDEKLNYLSHVHSLYYLKSLFVGTMNECLVYSNEFQTTIPGMFGLPEIENNICEGVVLKPVEPKFILDGKRVILKNKNQKFAENKAVAKTAPDPLPEHIQNVVMEMSKYCTEQRLDNVLSKLGEVSMKDFGNIMKLMNLDVLADFTKDFEDQFNALEKSEKKQVTKQIGKFNAPLIKKYMMENI